MILVLYIIQHVYLKTSRQLRLLDLEARSPLYSHFLETLTGLTTIRAFGWQGHEITTNEKFLDESQRPYYMMISIQRWLSFALDLVGAGTAVTLVALAVNLREKTSGGMLGVSKGVQAELLS